LQHVKPPKEYCLLHAQAERGPGGFDRDLRMNAAQLLRLCQDLELLGSATSAPDSAASPSALGCLTSSTVDVVFARCKALDGSSRRLGFQQWLRALAALSSHAGINLFAIITAHALQLQPHLSEEQAAHDAHAALPASRQAGALRPTNHRHFDYIKGDRDPGGAYRSAPRSLPAKRNQSPPAPATRIAAHEGPLPGRLLVLERVILEEQAKSMLVDGQVDAARAGAAAAGPSLSAAFPRGMSPGRQRQAVDAAAAWDAVVNSGSSSPARDRPRTAPSPPRSARLARVSTLDTAGVATEVWKFTPARPEAWDEVPAWFGAFAQRLQVRQPRYTQHPHLPRKQIQILVHDTHVPAVPGEQGGGAQWRGWRHAG
jgi:hypothetical protein